MHDDNAVERIQQRMAELRRELSYDVRDVRQSSRAMADLGRLFRRHPWGVAAAAIVIGYIVVPQKITGAYWDKQEDKGHPLEGMVDEQS